MNDEVFDDPSQQPVAVGQDIKQTVRENRKLIEVLRSQQQAAIQRFPLVFTMLGSFGLAATFYGFEHVIDQIPLLKSNPGIMLGVGILILLMTGTLYKKLS